jgi:hypothetical protein
MACPNISAWGSDAACMWGRIFKPIPVLQFKAQSQLQVTRPAEWRVISNYNENMQAMFSTVHVPRFTAVHMRLGGLTGEQAIEHVRGGGTPLNNFFSAVLCATRLARHYATAFPIVFVVDNHELRSQLQVRK